MSTTLLNYYESIASASRGMVVAAREGDWNEVFRIEELCSHLIAELNTVKDWDILSGEEERRRRALLRAILADDAEIRNLSEPWLSRLTGWLGLPPTTPRTGAYFH